MKIPVRIVAVNAAPGDQALFTTLLARAAHVQSATLPGERTVQRGPRIPLLLAVLTVLVASALAVNEIWSVRLTWGAA